MKVLLINVVCGIGSTGRICVEQAQKFRTQGNECYIAYGRGQAPKEEREYSVKIGNKVDNYTHLLYTRLFDRHGFGSKKATKKFLEWVDEYKPDLVWLHNLHGYYINIDLLFRWLSRHQKVKVKWTLHDCWAFTGHCSHFTYAGCNEWKDGCKHCIQKGSYPKSIFLSNSADNYIRKKELFCSLTDLSFITPSKWLASLVKESFLNKYPVEVIYNTVNTEVFKPIECNYKDIYGITKKTVLIGVANDWNKKKGLEDFLKLAMSIDNSYVVIMIGIKQGQLRNIVKRFTDKKTMKNVSSYERPVCICSNEEETAIRCNEEYIRVVELDEYEGASVLLFPHLKNATELAKFYTMADLFINTTYEDTYPTVNLESQACGTEVITYKTGGSVESVPVENQVEVGNIPELVELIKKKSKICNEK